MFGLSLEAIISIVVSFLIDFFVFLFSFLKNRKFKRDCLSDVQFKDDFIAKLRILPELIYQANIMYPYHGDGDKRFRYVCTTLFSDVSFTMEEQNMLSQMIEEILLCDKFDKLPRDTQVVEPKKEFFYEKKNNEKAEGQADLLANCASDTKHEPFTSIISRRY